jgi:4-amino-4-deoxy-L-arabinose transferase-like glycosyltransferase
MDEPLHTVAAYTHTFLADYRDNPEDPPLWKYWIMLPHRRGDLRVDLSRPALSNPSADFHLGAITIYRTSGFDGAGFLNRSRFMMLFLGVLLAITLARFAWHAAGPLAAVCATGLLCLDPNFLAHAPLVKNDVVMTLAMLAATYGVYRAGQRITLKNFCFLLIPCALAPTLKFSGVLIPPLVTLLLLTRAVLPEPWQIFGRNLNSCPRRLLGALVVMLVTGAITLFAIWAAYRFRYLPTPGAGEFDFTPHVQQAAEKAYFLKHDMMPTPSSTAPTPLMVRMILALNDRHLLPQSWLFGLLYTYHTSLVRPGYFLGQISDTGWWYYFPLVMLFKTPIATLIALAAATFVLLRRRAKSMWLILCLSMPVALYGFNALTTSLNLGIRHILPLYPFFFLVIAIALARFQRTWVVIALLVAVGGESLLAHPHYLPFFNFAFRSNRLSLLSDSNLDWGQDLPALADWQQRHPNDKLYLCYFGSADPAFYGIKYTNLPSGYFLNPLTEYPVVPGVLAVSATKLQGVYVYPDNNAFYTHLRNQPPREILGGSIYLFDFPLNVQRSRNSDQ